MTGEPTRPRIEPLPPDERATRQLNIFRTLAHNEPLSKGFLELGGHLLGGGVLPVRERELVILRTGFRSGSEYEFGQHTRIGRKGGLTEDEISRLADSHSGQWNTDDAALVALVDELCDENIVSEVTWQALKARWTDAELLELLVLAGFYRLVSGMLNTVGVALEPSVPGWPDGVVGGRSAPRQEQS
jgi:4-carboxymuconolactone decarboxylase